MELPKRKSESYHSYLLRLWCTNNQPPRLRVSLRDARTGETYQFADLDQLQSFLQQTISGSSWLSNAEDEQSNFNQFPGEK